MTTELGTPLRISLFQFDSFILGWVRQEVGDIRRGTADLSGRSRAVGV